MITIKANRTNLFCRALKIMPFNIVLLDPKPASTSFSLPRALCRVSLCEDKSSRTDPPICSVSANNLLPSSNCLLELSRICSASISRKTSGAQSSDLVNSSSRSVLSLASVWHVFITILYCGCFVHHSLILLWTKTCLYCKGNRNSRDLMLVYLWSWPFFR